MPFVDRKEAGRKLGATLALLHLEQPVVMGLPRGGIPVAAEVARALGAPLDVLVVRKLGCPWQPELGMGAIGEGDVTVLNEDLVMQLHVTREDIEDVERSERAELERRVRAYRGGREGIAVEGRTVVVVDDGIATGFTARAGGEVLRHRGARRVVLATPVAPNHAVQDLRAVADDVVVLETPRDFFAIGQFYADFAQTSDEEVAACLDEARSTVPSGGDDPAVTIELPGITLAGDLTIPAGAIGIVVFAHGSGSSRKSPRNQFVARALNESGLATLLFDLLTLGEETDRGNVFDISLLAERLVGVTRWLRARSDVGGLQVGYFGASTGAAAALWAAAELPGDVAAVVSRGGRPDLAAPKLAGVRAPTLLIVGGRDEPVLGWNRDAQAELRCPSALEVVPGATHLFEEPGALERVAELAGTWFVRYLRTAVPETG
ncbi:MAG: phosphoribosyltransferase family protein [Actinomycetota bacterium]